MDRGHKIRGTTSGSVQSHGCTLTTLKTPMLYRAFPSSPTMFRQAAQGGNFSNSCAALHQPAAL